MLKYDDCWGVLREIKAKKIALIKCERLKQASAWLDNNPEAGSSNNTQVTPVTLSGLDMCKETGGKSRRVVQPTDASWQPDQELIDEVKRDRAWMKQCRVRSYQGVADGSTQPSRRW